MAFVCPRCREPLKIDDSAFHCGRCAARYPREDGIADFSDGIYYDAFSPTTRLSPEALQGFEDEMKGTRARVTDFYLPRLSALRRRLKKPSVRVLDCGCGNGLSVDLLRDAGFDSWGNDSSLLRKWQWRERRNRDRLFVASGSRLPFPSGFFDAVISSGVIEHVGVIERAGPPYSVRAAPNQGEERSGFLRELLRVLDGSGRLWLDFPNGRFPIDFWHGTGEGGARFHSLRERFLPSFAEVRRHLAQLGAERRIHAISPHRRLQFQRIRRRWYGRLLSPAIAGFFRLMRVPGFRWLAASALNPYLVIEVAKPGA